MNCKRYLFCEQESNAFAEANKILLLTIEISSRLEYFINVALTAYYEFKGIK